MRYSRLIVAVFALSSIISYSQSQLLEKNLVQTSHGWEYEISNLSDNALLGFRFVVQCLSLNNTTAQTFQHQEDALVEFGGKAKLSPKTTRSVRIPASVANCPGKISAAIFEDGTVYGDQDSLEYLYDQRKGTYLGVSFAKNLVDQLPPGADLNGAADALDAQRAKVTSNRTVSVSTWSGQIATLSYLASVIEQHQLIPRWGQYSPAQWGQVSFTEAAHELLQRRSKDIRQAFEREFVGMTVNETSLDTLLATREKLVAEIRSQLDETSKLFLRSFHTLG